MRSAGLIFRNTLNVSFRMNFLDIAEKNIFISTRAKRCFIVLLQIGRKTFVSAFDYDKMSRVKVSNHSLVKCNCSLINALDYLISGADLVGIFSKHFPLFNFLSVCLK